MPRVDRDYVFEQLGDFHRRKEWYNFRCPYHRGESLNFGVSFRAGRFHCFSCGAAGPLPVLLYDLREGTATGFGGGRGLLGPKARPRPGEAKEDTSSALSKRLNSGRSDPGPEVDTDRWFRDRFEALPEVAGTALAGKMALEYLRRRGIQLDRLDVGLLDGYEGRVVFPFYDRGKVVFFQGRSFVPSPLKTINPDVEDGWYPKTDVLFRLECLNGGTVVLTEGIFDALKTEQAIGRSHRASCLLGKTISQRQIRLLRSAGVEWITVFLDGDANREAADLAIKLYKHKFGVRLVQYPNHMHEADPGSLDAGTIRSLLLSARPVGPTTELELALLSA